MSCYEKIISHDPQIDEIKEIASQVALTDSTVLITGESGTGKELLARAIHELSPRKNRGITSINCGAIPEHLLESELFGYESGAFTGARTNGKVGKLEKADGGTVFFDEIGDMPLLLQTKILRVLQDFIVERIGGNTSKPLDIRIISATNKDLSKEVQDNTFRLDLYYRLNVIPINIPPLRARKDDILLLAKHFIQEYNDKLNRNVKYIDSEVKNLLLDYYWPGNVRELKNVIEYLMNFCDGDTVSKDCLPKWICSNSESSLELSHYPYLDLERWEQALIIEALRRSKSKKSKVKEAANLLKINYSTLYRKMNKYNLHDENK